MMVNLVFRLLSFMILPSGKKNDGHTDVGLLTVNAKAMK
jgi:hypothetical protein